MLTPRSANEDVFFNDTATTEIYTLSQHDALPIFGDRARREVDVQVGLAEVLVLDPELFRARLDPRVGRLDALDRKSTRLNSSHANISYAVFCLKKKKIFSRICPHITSPYS